MKTNIITTFALFFIILGNAQTEVSKPKFSIGILGSGAFSGPKKFSNYSNYTLGLRFYKPIYKIFSLGLEVNYTQHLGTYSNFDAINEILFIKASPFKHFYGELGFQSAQKISSSRTTTTHKFNMFGALGFQTKIYKNLNFDSQIRTEIEYFETQNKLQAGLKIGLNYNF